MITVIQKSYGRLSEDVWGGYLMSWRVVGCFALNGGFCTKWGPKPIHVLCPHLKEFFNYYLLLPLTKWCPTTTHKNPLFTQIWVLTHPTYWPTWSWILIQQNRPQIFDEGLLGAKDKSDVNERKIQGWFVDFFFPHKSKNTHYFFFSFYKKKNVICKIAS